VVADLAEKPVAARRGIPGLEPGREDIILGGAVIVREILACFDRSWVVVTDAGLLEGLLLELVEKESGLPETLTTPLTWQLQKG
jgi:exopolyphosphatase/guanosine-5'-triphosphate,3'-diphosphate pyrophosphatase